MAYEWAQATSVGTQIRDLGKVGPTRQWHLYGVERCKGCAANAQARAAAALKDYLKKRAEVLGHGPWGVGYVTRSNEWVMICDKCYGTSRVVVSSETGTEIYFEVLDPFKAPCIAKGVVNVRG